MQLNIDFEKEQKISKRINPDSKYWVINVCMKRIVPFFLMYHILCYGCKQIEVKRQSLLVSNWNGQTLLLLNDKVNRSDDALARSLYQNRLMIWQKAVIDRSDDNGRKSFSKFIEGKPGDKIVAEVVNSGYRVSIVNTILQVARDEEIQRSVYVWSHNGWKRLKEDVVRIKGLHNLNDLLACQAVFGEGQNLGDIIVTKFDAENRIERVEYYLPGAYKKCFLELDLEEVK